MKAQFSSHVGRQAEQQVRHALSLWASTTADLMDPSALCPPAAVKEDQAPVRTPVSISFEGGQPPTTAGGVKQADPSVTPASKAAQRKEEGNAHFKAGRFDDAIKSYSDAITLDPGCSIFYSNRAMAYLQKKCYPQVIEDCSSALSYDPKNVKALARRAAAYKALNMMDHCILDYEDALRIEPANAQLKKELTAAKKQQLTLLQKETKKHRAADVVMAAPTPVETEGLVAISTRPLKKTLTTEASRSDSPTTTADVAAAPEKGPKSSEALPDKVPTTQASGGQPSTEKGGQSENTKMHEGNVQHDCVGGTEVDAKQGPGDRGSVGPVDDVSALPVPTSALQFENAWRTLRKTPSLRAYILVISPQNYRSIFKNSMSSEIFSDFVTVAALQARSGLCDHALSMLTSLAALPRFDVLVMFLEEPSLAELRELFDILKNSSCDAQAVEGCRKKFLTEI